MPIVDVEVVGAHTSTVSARQLADAIGELLGSPPGGTWVRFRTLEAGMYAENGTDAPDPLPVFVTVLSRQRRRDLPSVTAELASTIAASVGRPIERVHIEWSPPASGRMAFGGVLTE